MTTLRGLAIFLMMAAVGCIAPGGGDGDDDGGGGDFAISGKVAMTTARRTTAAAARTVTHVMAVDPESASPRRSLAAVGADGSFKLSVEAGRPYVLVFVDRSAVGADMVVGVFRAGTLDTVAPSIAGHLDLGMTMVDPATQTASSGVAYDALLAQLGISPEAAEYLGAIDDLSLRYANPDIDGDGVIDMEQDRRYALDFHVRANLRIGSATGHNVTVDDLTDQFLADAGDAVATPVFNLTSAYVLYPAALDATDYVGQGQGPPTTALSHGGVFHQSHADGSTPWAPTSFSGLGFGDTRAWGPDYNYESTPELELPGSGGSPATLAYTLGAIGRTLTFTNVVTRTRASLTETGTLAIFVRLVTSGGHYTSIDYRWMKRASAASWVPATAEEIALTISGDGGYISFHRAPSWHNEFGAMIPAQPSGSIAWAWAATGPDDVCGLAVSYDDKLGLRHFLGGADPNPGVSCTF
jgi:hypothetical protein